MKKIVSLFAAAVLFLSGCKAEEPLLKTGILRVAVTYELENTEEIAEKIANEMCVPYELIMIDNNEAQQILAEGSADIAIGRFSERENPNLAFRMTLPVAENRIYFICGKDMQFSTVAQLQGKSIGAGAQLPQTIRTSLLSVAMDKKFLCENAEAAAGMLKSGDIAVYVCFEDEALSLLSENNELRCCTPADIEPERYRVLIYGGNTDLFGAVNGVIGKTFILADN